MISRVPLKETTKEHRLLRKAAYWLTDYANVFRGQEDTPGVRLFAAKLRKLSAACRKAGKR